MLLYICSSHQQPSTFSASGGHGNNTRDTQEHILWQQQHYAE